MDVIFGKINRALVPVEYEGLDTQTAEVIVDNIKKTIEVNVKGNVDGAVLYTEHQDLTEEQKEIARENIGATDTTYQAGDNIDISNGTISFSSGEATLGQVPTADGDGGVTWEDPSGSAEGAVRYDEEQTLTPTQEKRAMDNMGILHSDIWRFKLENGETAMRRVLTYIDIDSNLVNEAIVGRRIVGSDPNVAGYAQAGFAVAG